MSLTLMRLWAIVAAILVCGYGLFGRAFGYIGLPSLKMFIGDAVLAVFMIVCTGAITRPWLNGLIRPTRFSGLFWALLFFLFYGVLELARGISFEYSPLTAIQNLVFNVYPLYFFIGLCASRAYPDLLGQIVRGMIWVSCSYGIIFFLFQTQLSAVVLPGTDVPMFGTPGGGMIFLGLSYLGQNLRRWSVPLVFSAFLVLAGQVRAEWLSLAAALVVQSILTGKFKRFFWSAASLMALLAVGFWLDFDIQSPAGRGGSVSSRELVARALSVVDKDAARDLSRNAGFYAGTVSWRQNWWSAIWSSVHADNETALLGHGYGFPLHDLVPYLRNVEIRTPHNIFFYALGYTGWIGVVAFFGFQAMLGLTLYRTWAATGQPFGVVLWLYTLIISLFGNVFETPSGAIPYYLMVGMAAGGLSDLEKTHHADHVRTQLALVAR
jgi:hypothetical protein